MLAATLVAALSKTCDVSVDLPCVCACVCACACVITCAYSHMCTLQCVYPLSYFFVPSRGLTEVLAAALVAALFEDLRCEC